MSAERAVRVLPADVFDYLEFSALVEGGIGRGSYSERRAPGGYGNVTPATHSCLCIHGHAGLTIAAGLADGEFGEIRRAINTAGIAEEDNDEAVYTINERKGVDDYDRVTWDEFVAELGIVRGDS